MADYNPLSIIVALKFIDLLSTDFVEWEAYKLGLIDSKGRKIRKAEGKEEKKYFRSWYNLVRNIKRLISTIPGGKTKFASYAAAFALLREAIIDETGQTPDDGLLVESIGRTSSLRSSLKGALPPGTYMVVDGFMKDILKEEDRSLMFKTESETYPTETPYGEIYLIDTETGRLAVCEKTIVRL